MITPDYEIAEPGIFNGIDPYNSKMSEAMPYQKDSHRVFTSGVLYPDL
ncbi:MAG: hypothetical protein R3A12_15925 [Ignavibacteria bacterium]